MIQQGYNIQNEIKQKFKIISQSPIRRKIFVSTYHYNTNIKLYHQLIQKPKIFKNYNLIIWILLIDLNIYI